jgi:hypothetical protein
LLDWNRLTARQVIGPKYPVAGTLSPTSVSQIWSVLTSSPRSPRRSVRVNTSAAALALTSPLGWYGGTIATPPVLAPAEELVLTSPLGW